MTADEKTEVGPVLLSGERLYLRPLEKSDLSYIQRWTNDSEIMALTGETTPMTETDANDFLKKCVMTPTEYGSLLF